MIVRLVVPWLMVVCTMLSVMSQPDGAPRLLPQPGIDVPPAIDADKYARIHQLVQESEVFNRGFTGFVLFDPQRNEYLYLHRPDNYFVPASNAKILTFFLAINLLSEGAPALFYQKEADGLQIWGTGYPLLLHPQFQQVDELQTWLRRQPGAIRFSNANYVDGRLGAGWSWDDYNDGYQAEMASLPLYGNMAIFTKSGRYGRIRSMPSRFEQNLVYRRDFINEPGLSRAESLNIFNFNSYALRSGGFTRRLPFVYSPELAAELLSDTLNRPVTVNHKPLPRRGQYEVLRVPVPDKLYQELLQDSDNFLAEQLLLMCSAQRYGRLDTRAILKYATDTLLRGLPHPIQWADGSGLSRYNQVTPRAFAMVLHQLYHLLPPDKLFSYFAAGGQSGTLRGNFVNGGRPYVYGKTGTLKNVNGLSGYVHTRGGRVLIFSFLHNNYLGGAGPYRAEMERVLKYVYENL